MHNNNNNNNPEPYIPLRAKAYQPTGGLTSVYPQTEAQDHPASLGWTRSQHVESASRCWPSRPGLPLQIISCPNSSQCLFGIGPLCRRSNPGPLRVSHSASAPQRPTVCIIATQHNIISKCFLYIVYSYISSKNVGRLLQRNLQPSVFSHFLFSRISSQFSKY